MALMKARLRPWSCASRRYTETPGLIIYCIADDWDCRRRDEMLPREASSDQTPDLRAGDCLLLVPAEDLHGEPVSSQAAHLLLLPPRVDAYEVDRAFGDVVAAQLRLLDREGRHEKLSRLQALVGQGVPEHQRPHEVGERVGLGRMAISVRRLGHDPGEVRVCHADE